MYPFIDWSFEFRVHEEGNRIQYITKIDLDYIDGRDQLKIWGHSVRAYIEEKTDIVSVKMQLPQQVDRVKIFQFGKREPVCFGENVGDGLNVYDGVKLQKNLFTFDEELRRLRMSRCQRKLLFKICMCRHYITEIYTVFIMISLSLNFIHSSCLHAFDSKKHKSDITR